MSRIMRKKKELGCSEDYVKIGKNVENLWEMNE